jgi:catechol 2,3-dioxygenase
MANPAALHPDTALGPVTLAVAERDRALGFYRDFLGMRVLGNDDGRVTVGVEGTPVLVLLPRPGLRPAPRRATGLYHAAILLPGRVELARVLRRLIESGHPFGASDHLVSEALYLDDPDGNGLEIYRDRPRQEWPRRGDGITLATLPLDADGVLRTLQDGAPPWRGMPAGTRVGHVHLKVGDVAEAERFYHGVVGFDVTARVPGAVFLSAGGYHHHLGANMWESAGAPPAPPDAAGLRAFVIFQPDAAALGTVRERLAAAGVDTRADGDDLVLEDPWRNTIVFRAAPHAAPEGVRT